MRAQAWLLPLASALLLACGDSEGAAESDPNLVGTGAAQFEEANEAGNSTRSTPEDTRYVLNATGLVISGSFETSVGTNDYYLINSGEFSGIDVRVFLNGKRLAEEAPDVVTTVDAQMDDGYPAIKGSDVTNVWVAPQLKYLVGISPMTAAGKSYEIQLKGH